MHKLMLSVFLCTGLAFSQGTTALLSGSITDPTGAAVPGAAVTVTNIETDQIVKTITNDKGEYALPSMASGTYRIVVTKAGFKAGSIAGVEIAAGVNATANMRLELGQTTETIEVQAGA